MNGKNPRKRPQKPPEKLPQKLPKIPVRREVLGMAPYAAPQEGRAGKLRLDFNENTVGCSPTVLRALSRLTAEQMAMYPEYEATTRRLARFFRVRPVELHLTNGIDDALHLIADTFIAPGDSVLVVEPTFDMYRFFAELAGARVISLRYTADMQFPVDRVVRALQRSPRVLYIANPNNPTGTLVTPPDLRKILRASPKTLVLVDEAYWDFSGLTVLPWIRRYPNLMVARTFSKSAGLAGLRLGCIFARQEILAIMRRACTPYPVNTTALVAAEAAIRDTRFGRAYTREVLLSRDLLAKGLVKLGARVYPSSANFILAYFGPRAAALVAGLRRQGILVRERRDFPERGYVRISAGTRKDTRRVLRAIEGML
jgi:histidinol-phosphate aminotransferase